MNDAEAVRRERAFAYPYDLRAESFVFDSASGQVAPVGGGLPDLLDGRVPVLAVGSNAAPSQLRRKYPAAGGHGVIPVVRARAHGIDSVYAARLARYGAVPATFVGSEGTTVQVHLTLLDPAQLDRMHATESVPTAYELVDVPVHAVDCGVELEGDVLAYRATSGPLLVGGEPVALAAIRAEGRVFRSLTEEQVLGEVARMLGLANAAEVVRRATVRDSSRRALGDSLRARSSA